MTFLSALLNVSLEAEENAGMSLELWINDGGHPSLRSAVQIRRDLVTTEVPTGSITAEMIEVCREQLPAKDKWGFCYRW